MKTLPFLTMLTFFLFIAFTKTNAQKSEDDAIKKVIQQETSTYFHKNYDGWADTWAHDSAVCIVRVSNAGHSETMGWNAVSRSYKQEIETMPVLDEATIAPYLNKTDYHIYVNGNM